VALGDVTNEVESGGGVAGGSAARLSRTVLALNVSPAGTPATLYSISSSAANRSAFDAGPLAEQVAKLLEHGARTVYACPVTPSQAGALGSVSHAGTGTGTITPSLAPHKQIRVKCVTGGTLGTAAFQFSLDGGVTYSSTVTSQSSAPWTYRVPRTFTTLSFAAATYVVDKTLTVGVDGTVTAGSGWVGTVTQTSSPIDNYDLVTTINRGGALGTAVLQVSPDGGVSTLPTMPVPSGGVVVLPGMGIVLTCAGTFTIDDTYSFLASPPGFSTSDLQTALTALSSSTSAPMVALLHNGSLPSSAAGAISAAGTLDTAIASADSQYGKQWLGMGECPSASAGGDTVVSGGAAIADTADTDSVVRAARMGVTYDRTSVFVATHRITSPLTGWKLKRPAGWAIASRYVEADPNSDVAEVGRGPLDVYAIGRDEFTASTSLHDAQLNVLRTYPTRGEDPYLAIEEGGVGWRNMTTDASFQDAGAVRVLCLFLIAITRAGQKYLASRQPVNADGTIAESARQPLSSDLDGVAKRSVGLLDGGDFSSPQASVASASVLASSQLGQAPRRLDIEYDLQPLALVSSVRNTVRFSGTLNVGA
jgi:hypothetical protein